MSTATRLHHPELECLEDRLTPSVSAPDLDLSVKAAAGNLNGAIFRQLDAQPDCKNSLDTFVHLDAPGKSTVEQGFNTNGSLRYDEKNGDTHALRLRDVPEVVIDGVKYREFVLDIDEKKSASGISLDELRIFVGSSGNLTGYNPVTHKLAGLNAVYDLDAGGDNWIKLDSKLNKKGEGDMVFLVRSDLLGEDPKAFVYLYSRFGDNIAANNAVEWSVAKHALTKGDGSTPNNTNSSIISGTVRDQTGTPMQDAIIFLDLDNDGERDDNEAWTVTDANGIYSFKNLASGAGAIYTVRMIPPQGFVQVSASPDPVSFDQPIKYQVVLDFVVQSDAPPAPF